MHSDDLHGEGSRSKGPLYPQMRPRPGGPSREEVARNQRERLCGAMIEAVCAYGYAATSVAEVSRLAGVSKRTFYEQFANKEGCMLATYDSIADCAKQRIARARAWHERDQDGELRAAFEAFVLAAAEQPKAARLALIEAPGLGGAVAARVERTRREFEQVVAAAIRGAAGGASLPPAVVRGVTYGIEHVVRANLVAGAEDRLMAAAGELAAWALAHASPVVAELSRLAPSHPGQNGRWPRVRARDDERARLLRAAADIVAHEGYAHLTPPRIVARAGVAEQTFRANYDSAEQCFLEAVDLVGLEMMTSAAAASRTAGDGPAGAYRGIAALIGYVAEDSVLRGLILVDASVEDLSTVAYRERALGRFADLLATRLPHAQQPPSVVAQATVGGVWGIIRHYLAGDAAHLLPGLAGQAAYVALAPVLGAEEAVRTILAEQDGGEPGVSG